MIGERRLAPPPSREIACAAGGTKLDNVLSTPATDLNHPAFAEQDQIDKQPERSSMRMLAPKSARSVAIKSLLILVVLSLLSSALSLRAATGGSISGTVLDPSGAVVAAATLQLVNTAQQTNYHAVSDKQGLYSFPNLPVGHYDLTISAAGFAPQRRPTLRWTRTQPSESMSRSQLAPKRPPSWSRVVRERRWIPLPLTWAK